MVEKSVTLQRQQADHDKADLVSKLVGKKRRTKKVTLELDGDQIELEFGAISSKKIDELYSANQPTAEQRIKGMAFNPETFNPALVSACAIEPKISEEDATEIFTSENWSTGELSFLVEICSDLCLQGLTAPFSAKG